MGVARHAVCGLAIATLLVAVVGCARTRVSRDSAGTSIGEDASGLYDAAEPGLYDATEPGFSALDASVMDGATTDATLRGADAEAVIDASELTQDAGMADAGMADAESAGAIGQPCDASTECVSADQAIDVPACIGPGVASWPHAEQWQGGYCTAQCTPSSKPGQGEPLAQDDCPAGALCVSVTEGVGVCLVACDDDTQCRASGEASYQCRRSLAGLHNSPLPRGVCMPTHCQSRGCPGSARCDC